MKKTIDKALKRYLNIIGIAIKLDDKFLLAIYEFIGIMFFPDLTSGTILHNIELVLLPRS